MSTQLIMVIVLLVALLAAAAEVLHARRVRRAAGLAFGPEEGARLWTRTVPPLRVLAGALSESNAEELRNAVGDALSDAFDVESVTFHDRGLTPVPMAREDWEITPLAYVILKAKDPTTDRIPSIPLHLDFHDRINSIVLPVLSPVIQINATGAGEPRPCDDLNLTMVLDMREWRDGRLRLDFGAMGDGLIPPLERLIDRDVKGFEREIGDDGLTIARLESDGTDVRIATERSWEFAFYPAEGAAPQLFRFPALLPGVTCTNLIYKRYAVERQCIPSASSTAAC